MHNNAFFRRRCKNKSCHQLFTPSHGLQVYCDPVCRQAHNKEVTNQKQKDARIALDLHRENDLVLEILYYRCLLTGDTEILTSTLQQLGFDFSAGELHLNTKTGQVICWTGQFGFEPLEHCPGKFILHKK